MERIYEKIIFNDLQKKMVILVGPRQTGKTWLALKVASHFSNALYLNYDNIDHRKIIEEQAWLDENDLLIFDEIHKMPQFMNYLKGVYDVRPRPRPHHQKILVTGSASFETFRHSGDSLAGRFFKHRIFPFSPAEVPEIGLELFMKRGGFPEPLLADNDTDAKRWQNQYLESMVRIDILDFKHIIELRSMELLIELLRNRIGSPISYAALSRDLQIAPSTVRNYLQILEQLFIIFRITPYSKNIARSILKEAKIYFFDIAMVKDETGLRFENLCAFSFYKEIAYLNDTMATDLSLHYLRTKEQKEVDFCILKDGKPTLLIETKFRDDSLAKNLKYFSTKYNIKACQLNYHIKQERKVAGIPLYAAKRFLPKLQDKLLQY